MNKRRIVNLLAAALLLMTGACEIQDRVADADFCHISPQGWDAADELQLELLTHEDSVAALRTRYTPVICVRHTGKCPYATLPLVFSRVAPDGREVSDTVKVRLFDAKTGAPLGRGYHGLYEVCDTLSPVQVASVPCQLTVAQAANDSTVAGINDVGIILLRR